jgi:hypothetical protein
MSNATNIIPFRRKSVLAWKDDGLVHDGDGQIRPGFVANTADDRYEIVPCYRIKYPSGWEFASCYSVTCHWIDPYRFQGRVGTWTNVEGPHPTVDAAKAAAQQHYEAKAWVLN